MISRTHFARFLVEKGYAESTSDVFAKYLGDGKPGYVGHRWSKLADAMKWIKAAGGEAVIAHPGRYDFSPVEFAAFFDEFIQLGGRAIEVVTGSHTPDQYREYAEVARRYGFYASRGSDFHAAGEGRIDLGTVAAASRRSQARLGVPGFEQQCRRIVTKLGKAAHDPRIQLRPI